MTSTEVLFFQRLTQAVPELVVAPQVAMSALVDLPARQNQGKYGNVNRAAFAQKRLDFVLFDRQTGAVDHVLELDDHTHDSAEATAQDRERDSLLKALGYQVSRFDARKMPSATALRQALGRQPPAA
jgi:hypothetical protein